MLNPETAGLLSDQDVIDRLFQHIDEGTTDLGLRAVAGAGIQLHKPGTIPSGNRPAPASTYCVLSFSSTS
jgi:hypothetical protein